MLWPIQKMKKQPDKTATMKQIFILVCIALSLCSCNSLKKLTVQKENRYDSAINKATRVMEIKRKDSAGSGTLTTTQTKTSDSGYTRITNVREYYSDEFDFDTDEKH